MHRSIRKDSSMRALFALVPLTFLATPALAAPAEDNDFEIPAELTDPAMAETLAKMLGTLAKTMMDMPIGEMQAAVEGREPTAADKQRTVRDLAGRDSNFEGKIEQQIATAMPRMQSTMKAMAKSLPIMAKSLEKVADQMEGELDRATANLPRPDYPKQ
jgi:hypothetical protein